MAEGMIDEYRTLCKEIEDVQALVFAAQKVRSDCDETADRLIQLAVDVLCNCRTRVLEEEVAHASP